jgi:hypothetical protein
MRIGKEIPCMIKRHNDHYHATKQVDRLNTLAVQDRLDWHILKLATIRN